MNDSEKEGVTLKQIWEELKKIPDKINLSKQYPDYITKNVFRAWVFSLLILFVVALGTNQWSINYSYAECTDVEPCKNPYYVCQEGPFVPGGEFSKIVAEEDCMPKELVPKEVKHLTDEYGTLRLLQPGQIIGNKPNFLNKNFNAIALLSFFLAIIINHFLYEIKMRRQY